MLRAAIIVRPFYDQTTSYLHRWNSDVVKEARDKISSVVDLNNDRANKKELESIIRKLQPDIILFNGHGGPDMILGQGHKILVKVGLNEYILKDSTVFSLSCSSAQLLGPASIKAGARAYIGYSQDFIFVYSDGYSTRAEQDPTAKLFLEPPRKIALHLVNGDSPVVSHTKGLNEFMKNIQHVLLSNSKEKYLARFLVWNMSNQVCLQN